MQESSSNGKYFVCSFADFVNRRNALIDRQYCSRKRKRNVDLWKRNKNKIARNSGLSYFTYKQIHMPAKKPNLLDVLCLSNCRRKCSEKISTDQRQALFSAFYSLDFNAKNVMLFNGIQRKNVKRHRKNVTKRKQNSFVYSIKLPSCNEATIVCKKAFCSLFQISTKKVEIIQKKHSAGQITPALDKRGKHSNRANKTMDEVVNAVVDHISSFPADSSHYSRNSNSNRKYLSPTLSISQMHKLYIEECTAKELPKQYFIKYGVYANTFSTKFNLSFGQPRSDTCATCDANEADENHKIKYRQAFEQQKVDRQRAKSDGNVVYLSIDLQQVMVLPKLTTSKAFYLRQLAFYNCGIHSIAANGATPFMMTWTENVAKRGSNEILSCLLDFVHSIEPKKHLIAWSDSCAGQNKNFNLIAFYQYLILHKYFEVIDHKFPEVGHSYLDSDRDFGRIEKVLKKHETIYSPEEYRSHIKSALPAKAKVVDMSEKFFNISGLVAGLCLYNNKRNDLNELVKFRDSIRWIRVERFGYYLYKDCLDENAPFKRVNITQSGNEPTDFEIEKNYVDQISVDNKKVDNLKEQIKFIPSQYHWFYNQIFDLNMKNNNPANKIGIETMKKKPAGLKKNLKTSRKMNKLKQLNTAKTPSKVNQKMWRETPNK